MAETDINTINIIKRLTNGSAKNQLKACAQYLCPIFPNGTCQDPSIIPIFIPFFVKILKSKTIQLQREGIYFIHVISTTSSGIYTTKHFTRKIIKAGAVEALLKLLLNSKNEDVLEKTLICLDNVGVDYPKIIIQKCFIDVNDGGVRNVENDESQNGIQDEVQTSAARTQNKRPKIKCITNLATRRSKRLKPAVVPSEISTNDNPDNNSMEDGEEESDDNLITFQHNNRGDDEETKENDAGIHSTETSLNNNANNSIHINQFSAFPTARSVNDNENNSNEAVIPLFPIQYNCPSELFFQRCCEKLNLKCDRQLYIRFLRRIEIYEILPDSIPNDSSRNGFESLSILFSGNLENAKMIQTKINGFIYDNLEKDDFLKVMSCRPSFTFKDIVFLADWFKFKFLFYANESWKTSENWNSEISDVLIFKQSGLDEGNFEVVFSLNDE